MAQTFICGQSRCRGIAEKYAVVHVAHAAIGADPQIAAPIFEQRARAEVGQAVAHLVADDARAARSHRECDSVPRRRPPTCFHRGPASWRARSCSTGRRAWSECVCRHSQSGKHHLHRFPPTARPSGRGRRCAHAPPRPGRRLLGTDAVCSSGTAAWTRSRSCRRGPDRWFRSRSRWPWAAERCWPAPSVSRSIPGLRADPEVPARCPQRNSAPCCWAATREP